MSIDFRTDSKGSMNRANFAAGLILTVIFALGFVLALGWDRKAAIFPLFVSGLGTVLAAAFMLKAVFSRESDPVETADSEVEKPDDDLEYVFATASLRTWAVVLGYFAAFFVGLAVLGLYVTATIFTVVYLRREGERSWRFSIAYAVVLLGVLYGVFAVVLVQPVAAGIFNIH